MTPIDLSWLDVVLTALVVVFASGLSLALALGLQRSLLVAAARMIAQLLLVGIALRFIFELSSPPITLLVIGGMLVAATIEVQARQGTRFSGFWRFGIGGAAVTIATVFVSGLALTTALQGAPWLDARHTIALVGIILGTTMNSTSLALDATLSAVAVERVAIEARLSLGEDFRTALGPVLRRAARTGMIPLINQMAGAGIITMPGIMTGQILAGMDPMAAAKYQIVLMLLLAGAGVIGVVVATQLTARVLSDRRHRLRLDRLVVTR